MKRTPLDFHFTAAHRVAANNARIICDMCPAGEAEILFEMFFLRSVWRKQIHPLNNLDMAFLALPLLDAGGGYVDAERFSAVKKGGSRRDSRPLVVEM
jgi:hypothetical protein